MGKEVTKTEASENGIIITVAGRPQRGKAAVARFIEAALRREGFTDVSVYNDLGEAPPQAAVTDKHKNQVVVIETLQIPNIVTGRMSTKTTIEPGEVPMAED